MSSSTMKPRQLRIKKISIGLFILFISSLTVFIITKTTHPRVWFDDLETEQIIRQEDAKVLLRIIERTLLQKNKEIVRWPKTLKRDAHPRIIFLSLSDGIGPAHVVIGSGKGFFKAIRDILIKADKIVKKGLAPKWMKMDIVKNTYEIKNVDFEYRFKSEPSLYGIAFDRRALIAFLPEEIIANDLINNENRLQINKIAKYIKREYNKNRGEKEFQRLAFSKEINVCRFDTISLFSDGRNNVLLYRGHRLYYHITPDDLLNSAILAERYLSEAIDEQGRFTYSYFPKSDSSSINYNILRHAGTVYAMLELYDAFGNDVILTAARKGLQYLLQSIRPLGYNMACVVEEGFVKLGGNALASIALAKYIEITKDQEYLDILVKLGEWIIHAQDDVGRFLIHKQQYPDGRISSFESQYYPGEAILALLRIYALEPVDTFLNAAERGARYIINARNKGLSNSEFTHDHWLLYALSDIYHYRPNSLYLTHSFKIAEAICQQQNTNPEYLDWLGSYYKPPRSTPTAVRSEGLSTAYILARDLGYSQEAGTFLRSLSLGIRFQLNTQFHPESVLYLPYPQRALGGFHSSLTDFEIRIDYVQHNISSILAFYRILQTDFKGSEMD